MDQQQLREVYEMVDSIPFTRTKKNISRDFSDGVMMAEVIHHYRPKAVALHNYPAANSFNKKVNNWNTLNTKVLKKLGLGISKQHMEDIINCVPLAIQIFLHQVFLKFQAPQQQAKITQQRQYDNTSKNNIRESMGKSISPIRNQKNRDVIKDLNSNQTDQVVGLVEEIEQAYAQLQKLQQISKLKDDMIRNLEKKVDKIIFS